MRFLGIDPGFRNVGVCCVQLFPERTLYAAHVYVAKKEPGPTIPDIAKRAHDIALQLEPWITSCDIICAEAMSFPRSSSVAAKMATCWGIIHALAAVHGKPIHQLSPQKIKLVLCGSKSASKSEVEAAVSKAFPQMAAILHQQKVIRSQQEHAFDSAAAVLAIAPSLV